jgi:hypothetical protein
MLTEHEVNERIKKIHGGKLRLTSPYTRANDTHTFVCNKGHEWLAKFNNVSNGNGCRICSYTNISNKLKLSQKLAEERVYKTHGDNIKLIAPYTSKGKNTFKCKAKGHRWTASFDNVVNGNGCQQCYGTVRLTQETAEEKIKEKHGDTLWLASPFTKLRDIHKFECDRGHKWEARYIIVAKGSPCRYCHPPCNGYSKIGLKWIKRWKKIVPYKIKTAKSGEKRLRGKSSKLYKVDGYCEKLKLVFEFDGDNWHGNPTRFESGSKPHPFSNKTAKQLYQDTIDRRKDLTAAGYTVISIWESEYREGYLYSTMRGKRNISAKLKQYIERLT